MRRFWGRGALVAGILLGVATVGSYAAGAQLGAPRGAIAAADGGAPAQTSANSPSNAGQTGLPAPFPGRPRIGPRGGHDFRP